jgi:hypothetical protein
MVFFASCPWRYPSQAWATVEDGIAVGERISLLQDVWVNLACVADGRAQDRTPDVCSRFKMGVSARKNLGSMKGFKSLLDAPKKRLGGASDTQIRFKPGQVIEKLGRGKSW